MRNPNRRPLTSSTRRASAQACIGIGLALVLACADKDPAKIGFENPPSLVVERKMITLRVTVANKDGKPLEGLALSYSATPADVLEVSTGGAFHCLKTGDASLVVSAGAVGATLPVKCRIPTEIALPPSLRFVLGAAPVAINARALGEGGRPLADVPVPITSSDPAVVTVEGDRATPVAVGKATLKTALGDIVAVTPVQVVEKIVSGPLVLEDGGARTWTLQAGTYDVEIDVQPIVRSRQGVTVSWDGTNCPAQLESQSLQMSCSFGGVATLTVKNPATLGLGARVSGTIHVVRVPPA